MYGLCAFRCDPTLRCLPNFGASYTCKPDPVGKYEFVYNTTQLELYKSVLKCCKFDFHGLVQCKLSSISCVTISQESYSSVLAIAAYASSHEG